MDEEGTKIQATIMGAYLRKHGKFLVEGECVLIKKFEVGDDRSPYRLTNHGHRLFLDYDTNMMKCNDAVGSPHGFSFTEFDLFLNNALPTNFVVDIIGYLYTYFDMHRNIYVSLWESYAEKMQKFVSKKPEGVIIVLILQTGKFTYSGGKAYVSSGFHGSTLLINDEIEEITAFKRSLLENSSDDSVSSRRLVSSQSVTSLQDEFLSNTPFKSIEEVNNTAMEMSVIVTGTLISFVPGFEWYYNACKACNKKVTTAYVITDPVDGSELVEQKKIIQCPTASCNTKVIVTVPRYKIPLRLQDNTSVVSLIVLDREARKMLKKSSKDLLDWILDDDSLSMIPDEIADLVGKKYAFKIDISNFNISNNYKTFTVSNFTDDPSIISKLEANFEVHQVNPSDSMNTKSIDFESQDTVNFKDTISSTSDSNTPTSLIVASNARTLLDDGGVGKNTTHSELKAEVYEIDDSPKQSATKPPRKFVEGGKATANATLLIPKKEK